MQMREYIQQWLTEHPGAVEKAPPPRAATAPTRCCALSRRTPCRPGRRRHRPTEHDQAISDLLEEFVRPAVEADGGAIDFRAFIDGTVHVRVLAPVVLLHGHPQGRHRTALTSKLDVVQSVVASTRHGGVHAHRIPQLKALRKARGWTQTDLAEKAGLKRTALGAYEEGRAEPCLAALVRLAHTLDVSLDTLVLGVPSIPSNRTCACCDSRGPGHRSRTHLRSQHQGAAGYADGYGDPEWWRSCPPRPAPPGVPRDRTLRFFQIEGDSMLPIPSGSWILCTHVERMEDVGSGRPHIVATRDDGLLFKRVENRMDVQGDLWMVSNNPLRPLLGGPGLRCAKPGAQSAGFPPIGRAERQPPGEPRPRKSENGRPKSRLHKPIECNHLQIQYPIIGFCRFPALSSTL